jgi:CRP/FNR family cyclic AMP-dependent transcriptional regulator
MDAQALADLPFFSALSPKARSRLAPHAQRIEVEAETQLTGEEAEGYLFFVIENGRAVVTQDERELRELGPGDFFGEIALLETSERTASVAARTPMQLIVVTRDAFRELVRDDRTAANEIEAAMRERWASPA